jgi:ATP-dependent DNA helicase RecG
MEDLGSGVRNMFHYVPLYVKDKNALPIIEEGDVFKLTVPYEKKSIDTFDFDRVSNIKNADKVLELIQANPKITMPEMAENLSVTVRTVERIMSKLVEENIVRRDGAKKDGIWVIVSG